MSSWFPEPGMWALSQGGLAPGLRAGGSVSSGTVRGQRAARAGAVRFCVSVCAVHARRQASGQNRDNLLSWEWRRPSLMPFGPLA